MKRIGLPVSDPTTAGVGCTPLSTQPLIALLLMTLQAERTDNVVGV